MVDEDDVYVCLHAPSLTSYTIWASKLKFEPLSLHMIIMDLKTYFFSFLSYPPFFHNFIKAINILIKTINISN